MPGPSNQNPGAQNAPQPGQGPQNANPNAEAMLGIGPENFEAVFLMHTHDGSSAGGKTLYGPFFIKDSLGRAWRLTVTNAGVLVPVKAF